MMLKAVRLEEVTKGVSADRAKKIFQGLNCGVLQQWRLRANDHGGRKKQRECSLLKTNEENTLKRRAQSVVYNSVTRTIKMKSGN